MRRHFSAEEEIRVVLDGLRGEESIARRSPRRSTIFGRRSSWRKRRRLTGDTARIATSSQSRINAASSALMIIRAHRLETKVDPGGDSATFSVPLTADASSIGPMQMLLAVVSDKPVPALDTLHSANLKLIAPHLIDDVRDAFGTVEADYFKFVN
jgi:hypothetical protein